MKNLINEIKEMLTIDNKNKEINIYTPADKDNGYLEYTIKDLGITQQCKLIAIDKKLNIMGLFYVLNENDFEKIEDYIYTCSTLRSIAVEKAKENNKIPYNIYCFIVFDDMKLNKEKRNEARNQFYKKIGQLLEDTDILEEVGVSYITVSEWEKGKNQNTINFALNRFLSPFLLNIRRKIGENSEDIKLWREKYITKVNELLDELDEDNDALLKEYIKEIKEEMGKLFIKERQVERDFNIDKVDKLSIRNFKVLKEIDVEFTNSLNFVIGSNGSGKSSLIQAIELWKTRTLDKNKVDIEHLKTFGADDNDKIKINDADFDPKKILNSTNTNIPFEEVCLNQEKLLEYAKGDKEEKEDVIFEQLGIGGDSLEKHLESEKEDVFSKIKALGEYIGVKVNTTETKTLKKFLEKIKQNIDKNLYWEVYRKNVEDLVNKINESILLNEKNDIVKSLIEVLQNSLLYIDKLEEKINELPESISCYNEDENSSEKINKLFSYIDKYINILESNEKLINNFSFELTQKLKLNDIEKLVKQWTLSKDNQDNLDAEEREKIEKEYKYLTNKRKRYQALKETYQKLDKFTDLLNHINNSFNRIDTVQTNEKEYIRLIEIFNTQEKDIINKLSNIMNNKKDIFEENKKVIRNELERIENLINENKKKRMKYSQFNFKEFWDENNKHIIDNFREVLSLEGNQNYEDIMDLTQQDNIFRIFELLNTFKIYEMDDKVEKLKDIFNNIHKENGLNVLYKKYSFLSKDLIGEIKRIKKEILNEFLLTEQTLVFSEVKDLINSSNYYFIDNIKFETKIKKIKLHIKNNLDVSKIYNTTEKLILGISSFITKLILFYKNDSSLMILDDPYVSMDKENVVSLTKFFISFFKLFTNRQIIILCPNEDVIDILEEQFPKYEENKKGSNKSIGIFYIKRISGYTSEVSEPMYLDGLGEALDYSEIIEINEN